MIHRFRQRIHRIGVRHAWDGVLYAIKSQPNFQIHIGISLIILVLMFMFPTESWERIILIFCILLGLVVEMLNTAIESVVDLVTTEWRQSAKLAKDIAAGAMLITAVGTATVGVWILGPYVW